MTKFVKTKIAAAILAGLVIVYAIYLAWIYIVLELVWNVIIKPLLGHV